MLFLWLLISCSPHGGDASPISCYNDRGEATDWFYMYKLPKEHGTASGLRYFLLDRGGADWAPGQGDINDTSGALGRTLGQLYTQTEVAYILYNDQEPQPPPLRPIHHRGGHTKGVLLLDTTQGFWLIHSTPYFPASPRAMGGYSYPDSGVHYGQNFLCVTFPLKSFQTIGEQLQINQPNVYSCDVPPSFAAAVPALAAACHKNGTWVPPANRSVALTSVGGTRFVDFAKGAAFNDDLYHSWVAPALRSDLLVQYWNRSGGILPSDCSLGWKVLGVTRVSPSGSPAYNHTKDHSKWAVSLGPAVFDSEGGGWLCVGDINRNRAEEKRGGGTLCQRDAAVWKAYRTAAVDFQPCGSAS
ncbi:deoxyribonuclease-2-alpha isoform X2 [Corythoichthys intestinalis]|uniref:deoxyribonuclease-2-alpha isoform X2 n=1 Tax=Corythoichthys intestinalis TaxID=161448 RepID=UPI0025A59FAC|nr:deoxyribonuclease-2-alpha isoform X2 [Corythoichthys intestinalis]